MANLDGGDFSKFTVIKNDDVEKYLTPSSKEALEDIKSDIYFSRIGDYKTDNTYLVINTDEPYANQIIDILKANGHWG